MMNRALKISVAIVYLLSSLPVFATNVGVTLQHGFGDSAITDVMGPAYGVVTKAQADEANQPESNRLMKNQSFTTEYSSYASKSGLVGQAQVMNNNIANLAATNDAVLAIAHSQGGLRTRAMLQNTYGSMTNAAAANKVKGMLTISTPHRGADLINNSPWFLGYTLGSIAGIAWTPEGALGGIGVTVLGTLAVHSGGLVDYVVGQGGQDMARNGGFMNALNNVPQQSCYWVSYQVQRWFAWWSWWETVNEQRCQMVPHPAFNPIPNQVKVLEVVGTKGEVEAWMRKVSNNAYSQELRWFIASVSTAVAAYYTGLAFVTFGATVPQSIAWTNWSVYCWALPSLIDVMFGGPNDTLIAQEAQRLPRSGAVTSAVGGTIAFPSVFVNENHYDVVGNYDLKDRTVAKFVDQIR
jgi:hypothetical protein